MISLDGGKLTVESYRLLPIDDTIAGDRAIGDEIEKIKKMVTEVGVRVAWLQRRSAAGGGAGRTCRIRLPIS